MRFNFHQIPTLPRLAWCARITSGAEDIQVFHGPWVENQDGSFSAGAWSGRYEKGDFDDADTMIGSGGKITPSGVIFSPPTNTIQWLAAMRVGNSLLVSNSTVFLFVQAGDGPDLAYPYYTMDVLKLRRWGLQHHGDHFYSQAGRRISLHKWDSILVDEHLQITRIKRKKPEEFRDFEAYAAYMDRTVREVFENAASPDRIHRYSPLAAISGGYDSATGAALAAAAGCREAFTFINEDDSTDYDDSGTSIAESLGMEITTYGGKDYLELPGMPEGEFCASLSFGTGVTHAVLEPQVEGKLLLTGYHGDIVWDTKAEFNNKNVMYPTGRQVTAASLHEFLLRTGSLHFPVPFAGAIHKPALQKISVSEEMAPWANKGAYNRPIARRIIESAGVPGHLFGQVKMATGHTLPLEDGSMKAESRQEFMAFFHSDLLQKQIAEMKRPPFQMAAFFILDLIYSLARRLPDKKMRLFRWLLPLTLHSDRLRRKNILMPYYYMFHWGFEKIKNRYQYKE